MSGSMVVVCLKLFHAKTKNKMEILDVFIYDAQSILDYFCSCNIGGFIFC